MKKAPSEIKNTFDFAYSEVSNKRSAIFIDYRDFSKRLNHFKSWNYIIKYQKNIIFQYKLALLVALKGESIWKGEEEEDGIVSSKVLENASLLIIDQDLG